MCRCFLLVSFALVSVAVFAQSVSADLGFSNNQIASATGGDVDANTLATGQVVRVKVVINNFNLPGQPAAPAGHFRVKIGLGNGLVLNPGFDLSTAPLNNYFNWTYDVSGSQPQIIGTSIAALPADFGAFADFQVKCMNSTTSTVSFNFLIANPQGTTTPLSDPATANNTGSNAYSIAAGAPLPVNFAAINAARNNCEVNLSWRVENQLNLQRYEVEGSKDNAAFTKLDEVAVKNQSSYGYSFPLTSQLKAPLLYVRIKSVDVDGSFRYSPTVTVSGICTSRMQLAVFPNPVSEVSSVTVVAKEGIFDGSYKVSVISSSGQLVQQRELKLSAAKSFPLFVTGLSAGKYHINIVNSLETSPTVLDFEKL